VTANSVTDINSGRMRKDGNSGIANVGEGLPEYCFSEESRVTSGCGGIETVTARAVLTYGMSAVIELCRLAFWSLPQSFNRVKGIKVTL
jgi:hypothetical protein